MRTTAFCSHLSDAQLRAALTRSLMTERDATADVVALLAEFDRRQLYLADGYRSLFVFCTDALHLSEDATYARIQAARASRKWPRLLRVLRDGSVTLTAIGLLAPHFTDANIDALIAEASHKRTDDVRLIVARLAPKPDVPSLVRKLPAKVAVAVSSQRRQESAPETPQSELDPSPLLTNGAGENATTNGAGQNATPEPIPATRRPVVAPLSPERYKIQITVDSETRDLLRQAQDLMRHAIPNGDPAVIISRALRVLIEDLLKRKTAATGRPRQPRAVEDGSRTIPASVRRDVWKRDRGQCAFEGARGRCAARGALEYHHVVPYAMGGQATVDNIELRCRAHNAHEARLAGLPPAPPIAASP